jgi:tetratricopeptide (TPR) repeat protein
MLLAPFPFGAQGEKMLKKLIVASCGLLFSLFLAAQTEKIVELEKKLNLISKKEQVAVLNELSEEYSFQSAEKAMAYAQRALDLAESLSDLEGKGQALKNIGDSYDEFGEVEKALQFYSRAETVFKQNGNEKALAKCINNSGAVYTNLGELEKARDCFLRSLAIMTRLNDPFEIASCEVNLGVVFRKLRQLETSLDYALRALPKFEKLGHARGIATTLNNIGLLYKDMGKFDRAIEYYLKSLKIEEQNNNKKGISRVLANVGNIYLNMKDSPKALDYFQRSLALDKGIGAKHSVAGMSLNIGNVYLEEKDYVRAADYFQKAMEIWRQIGNSEGIAQALGNLAVVYQQLKKSDQALDYSRQALAMNEKIKSQEGIVVTLKIIADIHEARHEYRQAMKYLQQGLPFVRGQKDQLLLNDYYAALSDVAANLGEYRQALEYYHSYVEVKDAILNKEANDKVVELAAKYEAEKKQQQISLLKKNNELLRMNGEIQRLQISSGHFRTGMLISVIALLLIVFFLLFRRYLHLLAFWKKKTYISHYKLERQIGSGAMGIVWQATDMTGAKKSVALKVIREEHASDQIQRKRFLNEAYLVDQLNHPNIIKVFERGEYQQTLYIAMEMLPGKSLAQVIRSGTRFTLAECYSIMRQLSDALTQIHSQGILHRDIKPENVMLLNGTSQTKTVKLLDFGLARAPSLTHLTETGEILGTVYYLAPEIITQRQVSAAGDVYALGVIFYELLTLEKPFLGENPAEIIRAILEREPINPSHFRPDLSAEQTTLVLRMLSKIPEQRPVGDELLTAFAAAG